MSDHVLLMDNSPALLDIQARLFHEVSSAVTVYTAKTHGEALDILRKHQIDIISISASMDKLCGLDLCRSVRRTHPHVFINMCTLKITEPERKLAESCGAHHISEMPMTAESVANLLLAHANMSGDRPSRLRLVL